MSIFKPTYITADDQVIDLPGSINRHASIGMLQDFARDAGYDPNVWGESHDEALTTFFARASLVKIEVEDPLNEIDWNPFYGALKSEPGLFAHDREVFEERIKNRILNGIIDANDKLIGTINVMPKISARIREKLEIDDENVEVYETGAGWTAESHRGLGLYTLFRREVLAQHDMQSRLLFSQSNGKGASLVNIREQWSLVPWRQLPFASALMGWRVGDGILGNEFMLSSGLRVPLAKGGLYQDPPIDFTVDPETGEISEEAKEALEDRFLIQSKMKLWTNDLAKAKRFEKKIREGLNIPKGHTDPAVEKHVYDDW